MSRRAVILGGTGAIGRAVATRLLRDGWSVDLTGRDAGRMPSELAERGARFHAADRADTAGTAAVIGSGADLLVDLLCFTADGARSLLPLLGDVASTVMLSSKAVYVDPEGRHVNSEEAPRFGRPISEDTPTVAPDESGEYDSREGYGSNKVAAEQVLLDSGRPVTVIRASKVHGPGSSPAREWAFVRRILDRRPVVLLADRGRGVDHPTAAANIAALASAVATRPGRRILNCADPDAPSGREIARTIARHLGHEWREVLLGESDPRAAGLGDHPWNARHPLVLDMTAAQRLGYRPEGDYAATVAAELDWLVTEHLAGREPFPGADAFARSFVDYAAEDAYLAG